MHTKRVVALLLTVAINACGGDDTPTTSAPDVHASATAVTYLNTALDIMQANSFYRSKLDWKTIRTNALAAADGAAAQKTSDTYPAIRAALLALGDHHSALFAPSSATSVAPTLLAPSPGQALGTTNVLTVAAAAMMHPADSLDGELLVGHFGYLRVPTFFPPPGGTSAPFTVFADTMQALIKAVDASNPCGWVVDVRHNLGGNTFSMFAGIGPIVGEGMSLGAFVNDSGVKNFWFYTAGGAGYTTNGTLGIFARVDRAPYTLRHPNPPVAVLTDSLTASAGEAIVVAFRGRPDTRTFGAPTNGVPTANGLFALSDGAFLNVMEALDADRNGNQYIDPIPPDEAIPTTAPPATDDAVVSAATAWLATQATCVSSAAVALPAPTSR